MTEWTPSLVEERLSEAAFVLKRLPADRRRGYFNVWPQIVHDFADKQLGKVAPYGVYDIAANTGWVNVGTDADTGAGMTVTC